MKMLKLTILIFALSSTVYAQAWDHDANLERIENSNSSTQNLILSDSSSHSKMNCCNDQEIQLPPPGARVATEFDHQS